MRRVPAAGLRLLAAGMVFGVACDSVTVTTPDPASMDLTASEITVAVGETAQLSATVRDQNGNQLGGQPVSWTSADAGVATVSSTGMVQGVAVGTTTVTATSGAASATARIIVRSAVGFTLDRTSVSFTTGINGTAGPETVLVSQTTGGGAQGLTLTTQYAGSAQGWLDVALSSDATPSSLVMSVNAAGLAAGTYSASVIVAAPDVQSQSISVSLQVTGAPAIGLSRSSVRFDAQQGGASPPRQDITITNVGGGSLPGLSATVSYPAGQAGGWLTATLQGALAPTLLQLTVQQGNLQPGTYTATVRVASSAAANSPVDLPVTLVVASSSLQPRINLSDTVATFTGAQSQPDPASQIINVTNGGGGSLSGLLTSVSYAAGQPTGWLQATLSSSTAPASLTLRVLTGSLSPGTYQASIEVVSQAASNSPRFITVLFTVNGPPTIGLSPTSVTFTGSAGGANPAAQAVAVTNLGGGAVTGLTTSISYGSGSGWLSTSLSATTAPATLTLNAAIGALAQGTYNATVTVSSPGAANSPVSLPVTFTVGPAAPGIAVSPTTLSFSAVRGGTNPAAQTANVTNSGGLPLTGLTSTATGYTGGASGWANTTLSSTTAPSTLTVSPQTTALGPGNYSATVQVASAVASNSPQNVTVNVAVPGVGLSPTNVAASVGVGGSTSRTVTISNAGGGSLSGYTSAVNYTSGGSGWLTPAFSGNTMTLSFSGAGLSAGTTHQATVTVTAAEDVVGAQVAVTLNVTAPPAIGLSPASVTLSDTGPVSMPATGSISVSNVGAGTLDGLSAAVSYSGGGSGWLTASLGSTTAPATISLTATPGSLGPGTYNATVTVSSSSSGVGNNPSAVPVTFTVGPRPTISLTSSTASFSSWQGGPDPSGTNITVSNSGTGTLDGLSASVTYGGGATGWLSATVGATAPATLALSATTGALAPGTYTATVAVSSTAARVTNSPQNVSVTFTVAQPPAIGLSPGSLTFNGFAGAAAPPSQIVNVTNAGGGTLSGLSVDSIVYASGSGWLNASLAGSTAPATLTATATPGALAVGTYNATVWVGSTAPGISNSPQSVAVTFNVQAPPTITLSSNAVSHNVSEAPGSPSTDSSSPVSVGDAGTQVTGLATNITYGSGTGWLSASLSSTTTPSTLTLQSSAGTLAPGTYTATVDVTSPVAGNSPQSVTVTLVVANAPSISLAATSPMLFNALAGGADPAPNATTMITNSGGGTLTGLATGITYLTPGGAGVPAACTAAATGWLAASLSATTAPATMTVSATTGALAAGVYCARVKATSPVARNSEPFTSTSPDFLVRFTIS